MSEAVVAPIRVLALEGGHNFREVGGYATPSGARLRRGLIWRSAGLDRLSASDCDRILGTEIWRQGFGPFDAAQDRPALRGRPGDDILESLIHDR